MTKLPSVSGERLVRALVRAGFIVLRQKGSHISLEKVTPEKKFKTVVPQHRSLDKGTLSHILKQAGLSIDELRELL